MIEHIVADAVINKCVGTRTAVKFIGSRAAVHRRAARARAEHIGVRSSDHLDLAAVRRRIDLFDRRNVSGARQIDRADVDRRAVDCDSRLAFVVAHARREVDARAVKRGARVVDEIDLPLRILERELLAADRHNQFIAAPSEVIGFDRGHAVEHHHVLRAVEVGNDVGAVARAVDKHIGAVSSDQLVGNVILAAVERRAMRARLELIFIAVADQMNRSACRRAVERLGCRNDVDRIDDHAVRRRRANLQPRLLTVVVEGHAVGKFAILKHLAANVDLDRVGGDDLVDRQLRFLVAVDVDGHGVLLVGEDELVARRSRNRDHILQLVIVDRIFAAAHRIDESVDALAAVELIVLAAADQCRLALARFDHRRLRARLEHHHSVGGGCVDQCDLLGEVRGVDDPAERILHDESRRLLGIKFDARGQTVGGRNEGGIDHSEADARASHELH